MLALVGAVLPWAVEGRAHEVPNRRLPVEAQMDTCLPRERDRRRRK
jgi:hypothetical protein